MKFDQLLYGVMLVFVVSMWLAYRRQAQIYKHYEAAQQLVLDQQAAQLKVAKDTLEAQQATVRLLEVIASKAS